MLKAFILEEIERNEVRFEVNPSHCSVADNIARETTLADCAGNVSDGLAVVSVETSYIQSTVRNNVVDLLNL
jgi:hypothetical protein